MNPPVPSRDRGQALSPEEGTLLAGLEAKVNAMLPPQYSCASGAPSPQSMGSASLKLGPDSRVAWAEIWTSFCDLALAGGPPHRGSLLDAPIPEEVESDPAGYQLVSEEIARGIRLTTGLTAAPAPVPGWVAVPCVAEDKASWLLRAVMAENVFVRQVDDVLHVPAGPWFRLAKEVKNVVVSLAKTCHYWDSHLSPEQRLAASETMRGVTLLEPSSRPEIRLRPDEYGAAAGWMAGAAGEATGLPAVAGVGWIGVRFADESTAAWFVRACIGEGVLARREEATLCSPVPDPAREGGAEVIERLRRLHRGWQAWRQAS
jgi:sirohydrochlorin cobaltochelatase